MITSLTIEGFKSIYSLKAFKLTPINIFIGANGAGKSNLISFFKLMKEMREGRLGFYSRKQGGANKLFYFGTKHTEKIQIQLVNDESNQSDLTFSLYPDANNGIIADEYQLTVKGTGKQVIYDGIIFDHNVFEKLDSVVQDYLNDFFDYQVYHFHDTGETSKMKVLQQYNDNLFFKPNAENIAPYLFMLKKNYPASYQEIVNVISLVLPFFGGFIFRDNESNIELEWYQKHYNDTPLNAHALSDGSLRFICLAVLLLQPIEKMPGTILIDEPELGLHPTAISILAELITTVAAQGIQVIIGTQSPELLNEFEIDNIIAVKNKNGHSEFSRLNKEDYTAFLDEYTTGDLWVRNIIQGGVSFYE